MESGYYKMNSEDGAVEAPPPSPTEASDDEITELPPLEGAPLGGAAPLEEYAPLDIMEDGGDSIPAALVFASEFAVDAFDPEVEADYTLWYEVHGGVGSWVSAVSRGGTWRKVRHTPRELAELRL